MRKLAWSVRMVSTATQTASDTRVRSAGMTIGTTTKMISKASSTKALRAKMPSTASVTPSSPPGIAPIKPPSSRSVPSARMTSVKVVAAQRAGDDERLAQHGAERRPVDLARREAAEEQRHRAHGGGLDGVEVARGDAAEQRHDEDQRRGGDEPVE